MRGNANELMKHAQDLMAICKERFLGGWYATAVRSSGEAMVLQGQIQEGIKQILAGFEAMKSEDVWIYLSGTFIYLAEAYAKTSQLEQGLMTLDEAFSLIKKSGERHWEAELYRAEAKLLLIEGDQAAVETSLQKAIEIASNQGVKMLELRATTDLARLWQEQGKDELAFQELSQIYSWFTEGFDTPELLAAKMLLEQLS